MIGIVDYKAGNLTSVRLALESQNLECRISDDPAFLLDCDRLIFPGVGAAGSAMHQLEQTPLKKTLKQYLDSGKPLLGICLGTQIILERSEEDGGIDCIGLLPGSAKLFKPLTGFPAKIPHMGWNQVNYNRKHPVFADIESGSDFYFVHSYHPEPELHGDIIAMTEYEGMRFASAMGRNNLVAVQFHPEKSGQIGLQLLRNFSVWNGKQEC